MKPREYTLIIEQDEDGVYVGEVLELPGCHSQAPDLVTLHERIREAVEVYLETLGEPESTSRFVALERLAV
jgi:predicted RNase H-like HicB family nuclease